MDINKFLSPYLLRCRRYEKLRKLNPRQFAELYERNIKGEGLFDDLVDQLPPKEKNDKTI